MIEAGSHGEGVDFEVQEPIGNKWYTIEGTPIQVSWKEFLPSITTEPLAPHETVALICPWGHIPEEKTIEPFAQPMADFSHKTTIALDTYTKRGHRHSLLKEAKAQQQFLEERGITDLTIVGASQGGSLGMYLSVLMQEQVNGLILIDPMGMYDQSPVEFVRNLKQEKKQMEDLLNCDDEQNTEKMKETIQLMDQEGAAEWDRQVKLAGGQLLYPIRLVSEILAMLKRNPYATEITVPVVIVHGAEDKLTQAKKFDLGIFDNSPAVRMIVAEKMGYHTLVALRPEQVARVSRYLLDRLQRTQQEEQSIQ